MKAKDLGPRKGVGATQIMEVILLWGKKIHDHTYSRKSAIKPARS